MKNLGWFLTQWFTPLHVATSVGAPEPEPTKPQPARGSYRVLKQIDGLFGIKYYVQEYKSYPYGGVNDLYWCTVASFESESEACETKARLVESRRKELLRATIIESVVVCE